MRAPRFPKLLLVALAAVLTSQVARADDTTKDPPSKGPTEKKDTSADHLKGLELELRPGFGGAPSDSPVQYDASSKVQVSGDLGDLLHGKSPYGPGFIGQVLLGYRFHPLVSAGLRGGMRMASAANLSDGSTNLARSSWDAGFYVRGYPLATSESVRKHLDPWISVGVEYMRDTQSFQRPIATSLGTNVRGDWTIDHHAVAIPLGIGVDYRLHPMFSVGPSFEYALAVPVAGCAEAAATGFSTVSYCSNKDPGKQFIQVSTYGVWSAGLDLKVTLF